MSNNTYTVGETAFLTVVSTLIAAFTSGLIWYATGYSEGVAAVQKDAVIQGYAKYAPDDEGNPQWQWIRFERTITGGLTKEVD